MRAGAVAGAVLAAALLAGCGAAGPGPQEWTDRMCSAVLPFMQTAVEGPTTGEPHQVVGDYLGRTTAALDRTLGDLDRLGPAPVDDGEALAANLQGGLGEVRSAFSGAKARVDALDPADPAAVERDLPGALEPLAQLGSATGPLDQMTGNPEIAATFRASATCGELTRLSESARTAAPDDPAAGGLNGSPGEGGGS